MGERRYPGRIAAPGLALGPLVRLADPQAAHALEAAGDAAAERGRLAAALATASSALAALVESSEGEMAAEILGFQLEMVADPALADPAYEAIDGGAPAAAAWVDAMAAQIAVFEADDDAYFQARAADLVDLRERVLLALAGDAAEQGDLPPGAILLAADLTPSRFLAFDWAALGGAALGHGNASSHVAMLARARGVPLLVQLGEVYTGAGASEAVLDAVTGTLVVDPGPATLAQYADRFADARAEAVAAADIIAKPAVTMAGAAVTVMVNVDDPDAVPDDILRAGDGVGLLRTEFLFMGRPDLPDETTQHRVYRRLLERLGGRPLVLRTLDIGGDKPLPSLGFAARERIPFLGLRGLRLCLARPELFRPQLRAAIRAATAGPLSIMLPMVSRAAEVTAARAMLEAEAQALDLPAPPLGIMVETPAAALALDTMPIDFASIGSNDLTQYVMAAARDSGGPVADLADPLDPAVLRLIGLVVKQATAHDLPLSLCGDMASDRAGLEALLDLGLTRLSVAPAALGRVKLWIGRHRGPGTLGSSN